MDAVLAFDRRRFLRATAGALAAAPLGLFACARASGAASGELDTILRATQWINSPRLTPASLAGKVVLVNFCTYTCINWLRSLPYVRAWAQKYRNGLVIIGVHTPEFAFEKNLDNVRRAIQVMKIDYPIVIDNDNVIWNAFRNQAWPALFFVDSRGRVRDQHFGEGEYERSEQILQRLLKESGVSPVPQGVVLIEARGIEAPADWKNLRSPENYLGYDRTQGFSSRGGAVLDRRRMYITPERLMLNQWALAGEWTMRHQFAELNAASGRIACRFHARDLHLVMGPVRRESPVRFRVTLDGEVPGEARGLDLDDTGSGRLIEPRVYQLIRQPGPIVDRQFEIEFLDPGAEAFSLTFG